MNSTKNSWIHDELRVLTSGYFRLLLEQQRGVHIDRRAAWPALALVIGRSPSAVKCKAQNVTAILREHGLPTLGGAYMTAIAPLTTPSARRCYQKLQTRRGMNHYQKALKFIVLEEVAALKRVGSL
jgi:hypothetical protein